MNLILNKIESIYWILIKDGMDKELFDQYIEIMEKKTIKQRIIDFF